MNYYTKLSIRLFLALLTAVLGSKLIYLILSKPTFYLSYLSVFFYNPIIRENYLLINNVKLIFVPACIAASAYLLLGLLILLTKDIKFQTSIKIFIIGSLAILIANLIRIFILIIILISYNFNTFQNLHLFFWKILSSIYVALIWILLTKYYNIKTIPIYSDLKEILKSINQSKTN